MTLFAYAGCLTTIASPATAASMTSAAIGVELRGDSRSEVAALGRERKNYGPVAGAAVASARGNRGGDRFALEVRKSCVLHDYDDVRTVLTQLLGTGGDTRGPRDERVDLST